MEFDARQMMIDLEAYLTQKYAEYLEHHKEFDTFRGKQLTDEDVVAVNKVIENIQKSFVDIYPICHFVAHRHQFVTNAVNSHDDFLDSIQKAGATRVEPESTHKAIIHGMPDVQN